MMSLESSQFKELDNLRTHPGRVTRKDTSVEGIVRPMILVKNSVIAVGKHLHFTPFPNPQMHERRPNPLRFYRQKKFFQSAYHRSAFARSPRSQVGLDYGMVARHPSFALEKSAFSGTSV